MAIRFRIAGLLVAIAIGVASFFSGGGDDDALHRDVGADRDDRRAATSIPVAGGVPRRSTNRPSSPAAADDDRSGEDVHIDRRAATSRLLDARARRTASTTSCSGDGFYDGIHRAAKDFVIQGGEP
jgi:hypothetical protein